MSENTDYEALGIYVYYKEQAEILLKRIGESSRDIGDILRGYTTHPIDTEALVIHAKQIETLEREHTTALATANGIRQRAQRPHIKRGESK